jgi:hypothetical protein
MTLRSSLYKLARLMGDINALHRGPRAVAKRLARKALGRIAGRAINKLIPPGGKR